MKHKCGKIDGKIITDSSGEGKRFVDCTFAEIRSR